MHATTFFGRLRILCGEVDGATSSEGFLVTELIELGFTSHSTLK